MNKKILVIEDDALICNILETILKNEGYQVEISMDGKAGLAAAEEFQPDLMILDLMMPVIDGFGVLKVLYEKKRKKIPKVIVLTAMGKMECVEQALQLGANSYLIKPIERQRLLHKIRGLLDDAK